MIRKITWARSAYASTSIDPGAIDTPMTAKLPEAQRKGLLMVTPLGRVGRADEIAALALFLASDESAFLSGLAIPIDGGLSAGVSLGVIEPLATYLGADG